MNIKSKKKYRPDRIWYGYSRKHGGNNARKVKSTTTPPGISIKVRDRVVPNFTLTNGKLRRTR